MKKIISFIKKYKYIIGIVGIYILLFYQMSNVHLYGDDYEVIVPFGSNSLKNILDFIISMMSYFWNDWSGRLVGHFIISSGLSFFGITFFRVLNPLFVFLIALYFSKIINIKQKYCLDQLVFTFSILILGLSVFITRESLYWAYGTILYTWSFALCLIPLYWIFKATSDETNLTLVQLILSVLIFILNCFVIETIPVMLILLFILMIIQNILSKNNKKISFQLLFLLIMITIAFVLMLCIPGNAGRISYLASDGPFYKISFIEKIYNKFSSYLGTFFFKKNLGFGFVSLAISSLLLYLKDKPKKWPIIGIGLGLIAMVVGTRFSDLFKTIDTLIYVNNGIQFDLVKVLCEIGIILLIISLIYCLFKTIPKNCYHLIYLLIISFVTTAIPVYALRWIAFRYYFIKIIIVLLLAVYQFFKLKPKDSIYSLFFTILYIINVNFTITLIIAVLSFCFIKYQNKIINIKSNKTALIIKKVLMIILSFYFVYNFITTILGYQKTTEIFVNNEKNIIEAKKNNDNNITLNRIISIYAWHSPNAVIMNATKKANRCIDWYVDDLFNNYYGIEDYNVIWQGKCLDEGGIYEK